MSEKITPTRSALIRARSKIKLAKKGHKLLKQRRDVLITEFFSHLERARDISGEINKAMESAHVSLSVANAYHGESLKNVAKKAIPADRINVNVKNIMGLKISIPDFYEIKESELSITLEDRINALIESSAKVDEAQDRFKRVLKLCMEMASTENIMRRLIKEIEKTKRRVNALEYIVLPRLQKESKLISFRLDEMERDSFFTLKMIKRKIAAKKKAA